MADPGNAAKMSSFQAKLSVFDPKLTLNQMTSENNYAGMTVNERLYEAGLLDDFYRAANRKDKDEMIALLMSVELDRSQAEETTDTILKNTAFYGFEP